MRKDQHKCQGLVRGLSRPTSCQFNALPGSKYCGRCQPTVTVVNPALPRERLKIGEWYIGEGACKVAQWEGELFTTINSEGEIVLLHYCSASYGFTPHRMVL